MLKKIFVIAILTYLLAFSCSATTVFSCSDDSGKNHFVITKKEVTITLGQQKPRTIMTDLSTTMRNSTLYFQLENRAARFALFINMYETDLISALDGNGDNSDEISGNVEYQESSFEVSCQIVTTP